jgi:ribosome-associated translation inhibitor RaiA
MVIQFNTDNNIAASEALTSPLKATIEDGLSRFKDQITRVEVHLTDENGDKVSENDKRCVLEVRMEGLKPVAVTNHANTHEEAVEGAIDKMKSSLDTIIGRLSNHK